VHPRDYHRIQRRRPPCHRRCRWWCSWCGCWCCARGFLRYAAGGPCGPQHPGEPQALLDLGEAPEVRGHDGVAGDVIACGATGKASEGRRGQGGVLGARGRREGRGEREKELRGGGEEGQGAEGEEGERSRGGGGGEGWGGRGRRSGRGGGREEADAAADGLCRALVVPVMTHHSDPGLVALREGVRTSGRGGSWRHHPWKRAHAMSQSRGVLLTQSQNRGGSPSKSQGKGALCIHEPRKEGPLHT